MICPVFGPVPSSRGTLFQGYFHGLQALQSTRQGGSRTGTDGWNMGGGNGNRTAGVSGKAGRAGTVVDWSGRCNRDGRTGE